MVGGRQRDKLMESDPPSSNAFGKQKRKARFDSWDPIRYRPKALKNWRRLFPALPFEAKRAMIGRKYPKHIRAQAFPARIPAGFVSPARAKALFAAFEAPPFLRFAGS